MLKVLPIQSKDVQKELCELCNATYYVNSFAYRADDEIFIGFQTELFVGERLVSVEKNNDTFFLTFDDFAMTVMPFHYKELNTKSQCSGLLAFKRVAGCNRYLKRKCTCGGDAEILFRALPGYVVRCKKCYESTVGFDCVRDAANSWNSGKTPCKINEIEQNYNKDHTFDLVVASVVFFHPLFLS